jgi:hypothetical protein
MSDRETRSSRNVEILSLTSKMNQIEVKAAMQ